MKKLKYIYLLDKFYQSLDLVRELDKILISEITKRPISYILDIGMGFGRIASQLVNNGIIVQGIEINEDRIEYIKKTKNNPNLKIEKKDARNIDYYATFDAAYCTSICQMIDFHQILDGVYKSIKPRGWFFISIDLNYENINKGQKDFNNKARKFKLSLNEHERSEFNDMLNKEIETFNFTYKNLNFWRKILKKYCFFIENSINFYSKNVLIVAQKH